MSDLVQQTRAAQNQRRDIQTVIEKAAPGLSAALADRIGVDRFIRAAVTSFRQTPKLGQCTDESILGALFVSAQLGLEVGGPRGLAYLVPYGKEASLVLGYRGWVDLFYRAGAKSVQWFLVRDGDHFRIGSDATHGLFYEWHPADLEEKRPVTGAVAQVMTATGGIVWDYMNLAQIEARRPSSWRGTPWEKWPDEMRLKTVLRHLSKRVPASTELALAISSDETVQRHLPGVAEHAVEHVPVAGLPAPAERPRQAPAARQQRPVAPPADVEEPTPPSPEEADYEAQSAAEYDAWLQQQGPV